MLKKLCVPLAFACALLFVSACGKKAEAQGDLKSMEQIHEEEGTPVAVREMKPAAFTAYLKYPATFMAASESTAKASVTDVVRTIRVKMGDAVQKDQVVMTLSQDNPNYQQAKANYQNAQATYKRTQALFEDSAVSRQSLDNARAQFEVAAAGLKSMDDAINVKALIGGFITQLNVRVTENVSPGTVLFTVSNLENVEARVWVSAKDIGFISEGTTVTTEWLGETLSGQVTQVNMIMDTEKKAFLVLADFRNAARHLTSGLNLDVNLETYRNDAALYIHRKELVTQDGQPFVYVEERGTAVRRPVVIGKTQGLLMEITGGLKAGDRLISEGSQLVRDGAKVSIVQPLPGAVRVE